LVATEVDHRTPIRQWPEGRLDWDNLQSTCKPCHAAKTRRESARGIGVGGSFSREFFPGDQRADPFENPGNWKSAPEGAVPSDFRRTRTEHDALQAQSDKPLTLRSELANDDSSQSQKPIENQPKMKPK
jgi:hypothetical protein